MKARAPAPPPPTPPVPAGIAVQVPTVSLPLSWYIDPFYKTIRTIVRPATAITRRKEITIKMKMPREAFEEIFKELAVGDAVGVDRDASTGWLTPTSPASSGINRFDFTIKRGSVTDKLFHGNLEVAAPPEPKRKRKLAEVAQIGEDDIYEVEAIVTSRKVGRKKTKTEYLVKWVDWPDETNTWEPASHIDPNIVAAYEAKPLRAPRHSVPTLHRRGSGCAKVLISHAAQKRGVVPETMSMLCGNWVVKYRESIDRSRMPTLELKVFVLSMDKRGHIIFPTDFATNTKAQLRMQARALLRKMIDDPLNPCDATMEPAMTGMGTFSIFKGAPERKLVVVPQQQ